MSSGLHALLTAMAPSPVVAPQMVDCDTLTMSAHADGVTAGLMQADATMARERAVLGPLCAALTAAQTIDVATLRAPFVELVTRIAEAVVRAELALSPDVIVRLVDEALAAITTDGPATLRLNPDDIGLIGEACPLPIVASPDLERGAVEIEGPDFVIDASLGARLAAIVGSLR